MTYNPSTQSGVTSKGTRFFFVVRRIEGELAFFACINPVNAPVEMFQSESVSDGLAFLEKNY